jgi:hypothetical protein
MAEALSGRAENLFRKATGHGREAVIAAIFWLKTRAAGIEYQLRYPRCGPIVPA